MDFICGRPSPTRLVGDEIRGLLSHIDSSQFKFRSMAGEEEEDLFDSEEDWEEDLFKRVGRRIRT